MVLVAVALTLTVLAFSAATAEQPVHISGYVTGPCDVTPAGTVDVYAGGELLGSGAIGVTGWADECRGSISVGNLDPADAYTVDAGSLSATVEAWRIEDGMTITLTKG